MMLDIPPHIEKFLSSQEKDDLETQERLLSLGKKLKKGLEEINDATGAWMVHYLAEKMDIIGIVDGEAKRAAQRDCFETILLLWEHRAHFLDEARPFKNFESIFRALDHIDPNKPNSSFFKSQNPNVQVPNEIEQSIKFITSLDAVTRIMISFFVRECTLRVTDQESLEWLDAISGITKADEARILFRVIPEIDKIDIEQNQKEKRKDELTRNIDRLEVFERLSGDIKYELKAELKTLEAEL